MALLRLPLRIIGLPLKRGIVHPAAAVGVPAAKARSTVFYYFETAPKEAGRRQSWTDWVTGKAGAAWMRMGEAPRNSWKSKIYVHGERLLNRIDFEELALLELDTTLVGQKLREKVPLVHPTSVTGSAVKGQFGALVGGRRALHRRGFWRWLVVIPLTAPFTIIPVIPNLPFFYAAWRAWSHYRAWKGSEWLEGLLRDGQIEGEADAGLDSGYGKDGRLGVAELGRLGIGSRFEREGVRAIEQIYKNN